MSVIRTLDDLADHLDANEATEASVNRRFYKDTRCGGWIALVPGGVRFGTIVEGIDATYDETLRFPFTAEQWDAHVREMELWAKAEWNASHGCEDCGPDDCGYVAIRPDCQTCGGHGVII